jgi:hypothetical protein
MLHNPTIQEEKTQDNLHGDALYRRWLSLVLPYASCELTYRSDRFPALSGLAKSFQRAVKDEYLAGLWRKDLLSGLSWIVWSYKQFDCSMYTDYYGMP